MLFAAFALILGSCSKEGEQGPAGPTGPAGPAGPAGSDANFTIGEYQVAAADFQGAYTEFPVAEITQDVFESGVVLVYIFDEFGYWNQIPSQWHPIIGFSYVWTADTQGILGLDHDPDVMPTDYSVRVVTMFQRTYDALPDGDIVNDYDRLVNYLQSK